MRRLQSPLAFTTLAAVLTCAVTGLVFSSYQLPPDPTRVVITEEGPRADGPADYVRWRNLSLRDEFGQLSDTGLMDAKAHADLMRALDLPAAAGISRGSWSSIGPGNVGGRVRALVIHPTSTDTMFIGSVSGGIWKTTNGGTTWSPVNDFMANLAVSAMVITPGNPSQMFAATGEGFYNSDGIRGAGIFRSLDGGTTWNPLPATSTAPAAGQTAADYHYNNELAISAAGTTLLVATRTGIFRSIDNGATFTRATMVGGGAIAVGLGIVDVDFHPTDSTRAVAATFTGTALYSTDGGATWTLAIGLPGAPNFTRSELTYAPSNGNIVYAGVDLDVGSLYKSIDGGQSFTEIFDGATDAVDPYCFQPGCAVSASQGWYDNLLFVSPNNENFLVWGGVDLWRSGTGGLSWNRMSRWQEHFNSGPTSAHADQHIAVAHPNYNGTSNRTVFFGNDGGVYKATDVTTVGGGVLPYQSGWTELNNGLAITQFYGAAGHPGTGRITGGTQDNGTLLYNPGVANAAENWGRPFGGDGGFSAYDSADSNYFYGEYVYAQIHRNTTGGASASSYIYSGLTDAANSNFAEFIAVFIKDPNENNRLLVGTVRLWRTNNVKAGTPAWETIKAQVASGGAISAIGVAPGNSAIIYAGHSTGRLYKTTVGTSAAATVAASWTTIDDNAGSNPLPNRRITRITIDPLNSDIVYVAFGGFSGDNLYKSVNGGLSWTDITGPSGGATALPDVPVRDLEIHPTNSNWIYAGTEIGIFASENGGSTWTLPHDGPSNVSVDELFILGDASESAPTLYAVTHGRGLFATPIAGVLPTAVDDSYSAPMNATLNVAAPGVLANDNSNGGGAMTAQLISNPAHGTVSLSANGSFSYTPALGFSGADSFTYRAVTGSGNSNVATVNITVTALPLPIALNDSYTTSSNTTLNVPVPGVLGNDSSNGGGAMTASLVTTAGHGTLALLADGSFSYAPNVGFSGTDSFTYRAVTAAGTSNTATVTITVIAMPPTLQPPTGLYASLIAGDQITLRWTPPVGSIVPTDYVLEGGINPGEVLASISIGSTSPTFTFRAPSGAFYIRIHSIAGTDRSAASNEIRIFVNVPQPPSAPSNLLGLVDGTNLALTWRNTFAGGAATSVLLDVSGAIAATLPLPIADTFSFANVPAGTYTLSLRAANGVGTSPSSNAVTLTFPSPCSGAPQVPANFLASKVGNVISVMWDSPNSGPASTGFVLVVSGSFNGALPTTLRSLSGAVGSGSYTLSVYATNSCGASAATATQTVNIP